MSLSHCPTGKSATVFASVFGLVALIATPSHAASFRYTTLTNEAVFTEGTAEVAQSTYDGTFTNTVFNPFSGLTQTFAGFYQVQSGTLGKAVSLSAVQQSPTDRTGLGASGLTRIDYLDTPQSVATVPGAFIVPPGITEFDFKFVPAAVAGAPVVLSNGWEAVLVSASGPEAVPEPGTLLAMLSLLGLGIGLKQFQHKNN